MADAANEESSAAAERLNAAIDRLLAEEAPAPTAHDDEAELLAVAALLKRVRPDAAEPRLAYADVLGARLLAARPQPAKGAVSRRRALATGAAVAAGAAGFALGRLADPAVSSPDPAPAPRPPARDLTIQRGEWFPVAQVADVPPGHVVAFTAGAVLGHLLNRDGDLVALSAVCTHMGCLLTWQADEQRFLCPCHNAHFSNEGVIQPTPDYPWTPPPLPRLTVKVEDDRVWVWSTGSEGPRHGVTHTTTTIPPERRAASENSSPRAHRAGTLHSGCAHSSSVPTAGCPRARDEP